MRLPFLGLRIMRTTWILLNVLVLALAVVAKPKGEIVSEVLQSIFVNYDPRVRPNYGGNATEVSVSAYIIRGIAFKDGVMSLEAYFRESWNDPRLKYMSTMGFGENISTGHQLRGKLWEPDTFLANGDTHFNELETFYKLSPNGDVFKSVKLVINVQCNLNMKNYPMDVQICPMEFESYGYTAADIFYRFTKGKASVSLFHVSFEEFHLVKFAWVESTISLTTGNYSRLMIKLQLFRNYWHEIKCIFVPAILTFLACCVVFWLPAYSVLLRGIVALMCLKISMGLMTKGLQAVPHYVDYMTRVDEYMIMCAVMSLVALLESVTVYYLHTGSVPLPGDSKNNEETEIIVDSPTNDNNKVTKDDDKEKQGFSHYFGKGTKYALKLRHHRNTPKKIDVIFRIIFPSFFLLFNIIFWAVTYSSVNSQIE